MKRSDMELDGDCRVFYRNRRGKLCDATATYRAENKDWILFDNSRVAAVPRQRLVRLEEV